MCFTDMKMLRYAASALTVLTLATGLGAPAGAQAPLVEITLAMNAPGSGNWPVYIADQQGFFRDEGLRVNTVLSGSNTATINLIASGDANIGLDGSDIEIEAIVHGLPLKIVAPEFGPNPYTVVAAAGINTWAQLKGKTIVTGALQDVSSLTFFKLASLQHLTKADFSVINSPSSSSRYEALLSGTIQATVLSQPFDILAQEHGYHALAVASDTIKLWADTCFAVNAKWAPANRATIVHFIRALKKAVRYGYANQDGAVAALIRATNIAEGTARKAYDVDFTHKHVFVINDRSSLAADLKTMGATIVDAGAAAAMPPIDDVFDASYLRDAAR
jgi:ABC-type nitrate/sulfonate/bicarbonate transport system substrate-binding protein